MKRRFLISLWLVVFGAISFSFSQENSAMTKISHDSIVVGDLVKLQFVLPADRSDTIQFPSFPNDTIVSGIVVLKRDTLVFDADKSLFTQTYSISAYETGNYTIPKQSIVINSLSDSIVFLSEPAVLKVSPAVVIDTLSVDTVYATQSGVVIFGRNSFMEEVEAQIPDSLRQTLSQDSLQILQQQILQNLVGQFSGQVFRASGLKSEKDLFQIIEAPKQRLFIVNDKEILESFRIPGAHDTVFVQEMDTVVASVALFTTYQIKDISEDYYKTKFNLKEFLFYIWHFIKHNWYWILAVIILGLAAIYYYFYYSKGKKIFTIQEKPKEPAHIIAFRELERIKKEKLWLKNQVKSYYTELTDAIRRYLENRFDLPAMERTSNEILGSLSDTDFLNKELTAHLKEVLERADFVKFAKSMPLPDENERSFSIIWDIVENTKLLTDSDELEENKNAEQITKS
jgi:hypothetical protein